MNNTSIHYLKISSFGKKSENLKKMFNQIFLHTHTEIGHLKSIAIFSNFRKNLNGIKNIQRKVFKTLEAEIFPI